MCNITPGYLISWFNAAVLDFPIKTVKWQEIASCIHLILNSLWILPFIIEERFHMNLSVLTQKPLFLSIITATKSKVLTYYK